MSGDLEEGEARTIKQTNEKKRRGEIMSGG